MKKFFTIAVVLLVSLSSCSKASSSDTTNTTHKSKQNKVNRFYFYEPTRYALNAPICYTKIYENEIADKAYISYIKTT